MFFIIQGPPKSSYIKLYIKTAVMSIIGYGCMCICLARSAKLPTGLYISFCFIFFNDFSETNCLKIRWTDFHNIFTEGKHFGCRWSIWTSFFDILRDVAMATDFVKKMANSPLSFLWHSETEWDIATSMSALTAQMMPVYRVKILWNAVQ